MTKPTIPPELLARATLTDNEIVLAKTFVNYQLLGIPLTYGVCEFERSIAKAQCDKAISVLWPMLAAKDNEPDIAYQGHLQEELWAANNKITLLCESLAAKDAEIAALCERLREHTDRYQQALVEIERLKAALEQWAEFAATWMRHKDGCNCYYDKKHQIKQHRACSCGLDKEYHAVRQGCGKP